MWKEASIPVSPTHGFGVYKQGLATQPEFPSSKKGPFSHETFQSIRVSEEDESRLKDVA